MNHYKPTQEELDFLKSYDPSIFDRPSLAADIVVFSILDSGYRTNTRKPPEKCLKVLMVRRGEYPYLDWWAIPGGFCQKHEDVADTARRKLLEKTNVQDVFLSLVGSYGKENRDPRGWIISNTFMALIDGTQQKLESTTNAQEACWFSVTLEEISSEEKTDEQSHASITSYKLTLENPDVPEDLSAVVLETRKWKNYHTTTSYEINSVQNISFDHAAILTESILQLRQLSQDNWRVPFDLMPELFTLTQLQTAFELVQNTKLLTPNFRRKIADYVEETDLVQDGEKFRPAKLYRRKTDQFI